MNLKGSVAIRRTNVVERADSVVPRKAANHWRSNWKRNIYRMKFRRCYRDDTTTPRPNCGNTSKPAKMKYLGWDRTWNQWRTWLWSWLSKIKGHLFKRKILISKADVVTISRNWTRLKGNLKVNDQETHNSSKTRLNHNYSQSRQKNSVKPSRCSLKNCPINIWSARKPIDSFKRHIKK